MLVKYNVTMYEITRRELQQYASFFTKSFFGVHVCCTMFRSRASAITFANSCNDCDTVTTKVNSDRKK